MEAFSETWWTIEVKRTVGTVGLRAKAIFGCGSGYDRRWQQAPVARDKEALQLPLLRHRMPLPRANLGCGWRRT